MKKLILCTYMVVCVAMVDGAIAAVVGYSCTTGDCIQNNATYSGSSCSCDGYMLSIYPEYRCSADIDCAYDDDDTEYGRCYNGWCARVIRTGNCKDYQYAGENHATDGLFDNTCYKCPSNATCDGSDMNCNAGYYRVYLGANKQVIDLSSTDYIGALLLGCQKCPSGTSGETVTSDYGALEIWDCYATGGTDDTGTYIYTSDCHYEEQLHNKKSPIMGDFNRI